MLHQLLQIRPMRLRNLVDIEELQVVCCRVVQCTHELHVIADRDSTICQAFANVLLIEQFRCKSCIGFPRVTAARTAVESSLQRIILGSATVPAEHHESRETINDAEPRSCEPLPSSMATPETRASKMLAAKGSVRVDPLN